MSINSRCLPLVIIGFLSIANIYCSSTNKSNITILKIGLRSSYKQFIAELEPQPDYVDKAKALIPGNYNRILPYKIGSLTGVLFVLDSEDVILGMDWYLDSLPAWPYEISFPKLSRTGYPWRHANIEDYKYLSDLLIAGLGKPDQTLDAMNKMMSWDKEHITLTYLGKNRAISIRKNQGETIERYNGFAFRSVYSEDIFPRFAIGKTRKEYQAVSFYHDTIIEGSNGTWYQAYTYDTLMGLPGLLFHDINSLYKDTVSTLTSWTFKTVISNYNNSAIVDLLKENIEAHLGKSVRDTTFFNEDTQANDFYYEWQTDSIAYSIYYTPEEEISIDARSRKVYK